MIITIILIIYIINIIIPVIIIIFITIMFLLFLFAVVIRISLIVFISLTATAAVVVYLFATAVLMFHFLIHLLTTFTDGSTIVVSMLIMHFTELPYIHRSLFLCSSSFAYKFLPGLGANISFRRF